MNKNTNCRTFIKGLIAVFGILPASVLAQDTEEPVEDRITLDPLVVVASKTPRPLSEVAAQVTVIDAATIRNNMAEDLDGVLKYEPGIDLETSGTRFGPSSINIRGIGGNRVAIEQDGIPVRDRFAVGSFSNGGRALVETDRIKRVEVLHGPASAIYGSNALGGVVAITTFDPSDLLTHSADEYGLGLRGGYQGVNDSWFGSGVAVIGNENHGLLFAATYREGHELDNQAPPETPTDPQHWDSSDFMLRYTFDTSTGNLLRVTATGQQRDVETEIKSQLGYGRRFRNTTSLRGIDHDENTRFSLDYEFSWGDWERGRLQVFRTRYETEQLTLETRGKGRIPLDLRREFFYDQEHTGLEFNLFRQVNWGASEHHFGLGVEWLQTDTEEKRDGLQTNLLTGTTTNVVLGESMPVRDFPNSRSRELGVFVQDEISLAGGRWEIIPAVRWDRYELEPRPDALWLSGFPDLEVVSVEENEFTPRLGILFHAADNWSLYGQYARGFRAPPFEDVNIGLDLPLFGYRAIPNPDLKSESSNGFEFGARRVIAGSRFSLAIYHTDYDDFIDSRALLGVDPETGDLLFQSRNIDQARIYGVDIRYDQDLGEWSDALQGWMFNAAAYWSKGENRDTKQPLNSIAPPQAVLGASWVSDSGVWNLGITTTLTAAKKNGDIDETGGVRFATPGWGIVDVTAGWHHSDWLELRAGVFNLGDKTYWRWLDVSRLDASDPMIPILSRPGRNYSLTARFSF